MIKGIGLLFLILLGVCLYGELPDIFYGKCFNKQGEFITEEVHEVMKQDGKVVKIRTQYYLPGASKFYAYAESAFQGSDYLPNFYFHRMTNGFTSRALKEGRTDLVMFRKEGEKDYYFEKEYTIESDMVVGHGFYFYMFHFLDEMLTHPKLQIPVHFLVPNKLSKYHFNMTAKRDPENPEVAIVTLVTENILGRIFYKRIILKVDLNERHLMSYEGPNTFLYGTQKTPYVKIQYSNQKS
ncbi:MAG: hypothetical protein KDK64_03880 [Chlamydiia bacterium]|nr:hypothetical protein [Chlamydiia bacterium]